MSNVTNKNPLVLDTAGIVVYPHSVVIKSIIINASGDNWSVILKDAVGGNIVFEMDSATVNERCRQFDQVVEFAGLYIDTLTNIKNVLVYLEA